MKPLLRTLAVALALFATTLATTAATATYNAVLQAVKENNAWQNLPVANNLLWVTDSGGNRNPGLSWQQFDFGSGAEWAVKCVTWTNYAPAYDPAVTGYHALKQASNRQLFVTLAGQMTSYFANDPTQARTHDRIAQLLGMDTLSGNNHFAEFWVRPSDLFRPSRDYTLTGTTRNKNEAFTGGNPDPAYFGQPRYNGTVPAYETELIRMIDNTPVQPYDSPGQASDPYHWMFPFSGLGYTFDWATDAGKTDPATINVGSTLHIGLSEFIVKTNGSYITESWNAELSYIPEPLAALLATVTALAALLLHRRTTRPRTP